MAGNKQYFDAAMRRGQEFSTTKEWEKAIREYMRAAVEFPNDINMRSNLADVLFRMGQNEKALEVYEGLVKYNPINTNALQRIAEIYTRQGKETEAINTLIRLKEIFQKNNQPQPLIDTLQQIIKIKPGQTGAYRELIDHAKARGDRLTSAQTALAYAKYTKSTGAFQNALSSTDEALLFIPGMEEAVQLREELVALIPPEAPETSQLKPPVILKENQETINKLLEQAEAALSTGDTGLAITNYEMAIEAGADGAEVYYTVGGLYAQTGNFEKAGNYLRLATKNQDYAASAFFALGQMYDQAGQLEEAIRAYEDALTRVDLQQIGQDEIDELISMYEPLGEDYLKTGQEARAANLYNRLREFITSKRLRTKKTAAVIIKGRELSDNIAGKASESDLNGGFIATSSLSLGTRDLLETTTQATIEEENPALETTPRQPKNGQGDQPEVEASPLIPVKSNGTTLNGSNLGPAIPAPAGLPLIFPVKLLTMEPNPANYPYIRAAEDFIKRGFILAAMDACQEVIRYFPDYLPAQVILAEIYVNQNRLEQARTKYQFVVDIYQMRLEPLKAVEVYKRLAEISPENIGMRTKLANLMLQLGLKENAAEISLDIIQNYIKSGQIERAAEECQKLRNQAPDSLLIRLQYGELLNRLHRFDEALVEFQRANEIDPPNLTALCWLNITCSLNEEGEVKWSSFKTVIDRSRESLENLSQVLEIYSEACKLYPHPGLLYFMGCLQLEAKQIPEARSSFEEAIKNLADFKSNRSNEYTLLTRWQLGNDYLNNNRTEEGVSELSKVVALLEKVDPRDYGSEEGGYSSLPGKAGIYRKLAHAFISSGKIDYAAKALRTVKRLIPFDREVYFDLADINFQQGNLNEALVELGELAAHYEQGNKTEDMIEVLKQMVRLAPNKIEVRDKLSQVYLQRGQIPEGLHELDELAELQRKNGRLKDAVRTLQKAAEINWMMGQQSKSYDLYDRIVRIAPGDIEARQQLVNLHIMSGRVADAATEQRVIAQISLQTNQTQEAIAALHQVIMLEPEDTRAYFQLATVLTTVGEYGQANKLYSRILRLEPESEKARKLKAQVEQKGIETGQIQPDQV